MADLDAKIRKLLSLAKNNPSEEEAAVAFARAQELATLAGLDLDDLTEADACIAPPPRVVEEIATRLLVTMGRKIEAWRYVIANAVARANQCAVYSSRDHGCVTLVAYGQPRDLDLVVQIYEAIAGQIEVMAADALAKYKADPALDPRFDEPPRVYIHAWRIGCANTIANRLPTPEQTIAKARHALPAGSSTAALVRCDDAAAYIAKVDAKVKDHAKKIGLVTRGGSIGRTSSQRGYSAGSKAGATIGLGVRGALGKGRS